MTTSQDTAAPGGAIRHGRLDPIASRVPFFYGWVMLPLAIAAHWCTSPGQTFGISVFNPSLRAALGLSATQLTGAYLVGSFCACFAIPAFGWMMDRHGIRRTMTLVVALLGAACLAMSQVRGIISLTLAFLLLRMLGQGALTLLSSNTLAMWFHRRLGTVSGILSASMAGAFGLMPPMFLFLIDRFGWRTAYALIGIGVWTLMFPLLAVLFRNRPEDVGQRLDGDSAAEPPPSAAAGTEQSTDDVIVHHVWDLRAAMGTRAFWICTLMHAVWAMVGTGLVFNIIPLFEDHGLTAADAAASLSTLAVGMGAMQFLGGMLADRVPLRWLLTAAMLGITAAVAILLQAYSQLPAHAFAFLFGASQGLFVAVGHTLWARYYGRSHLGKIRGSVWMATVAGSSFGPFLMGSLMDATGSYASALWIFLALAALLAPAGYFATQPQPRQA